MFLGVYTLFLLYWLFVSHGSSQYRNKFSGSFLNTDYITQLFGEHFWGSPFFFVFIMLGLPAVMCQRAEIHAAKTVRNPRKENHVEFPVRKKRKYF